MSKLEKLGVLAWAGLAVLLVVAATGLVALPGAGADPVAPAVTCNIQTVGNGTGANMSCSGSGGVTGDDIGVAASDDGDQWSAYSDIQLIPQSDSVVDGSGDFQVQAECTETDSSGCNGASPPASEPDWSLTVVESLPGPVLAVFVPADEMADCEANWGGDSTCYEDDQLSVSVTTQSFSDGDYLSYPDYPTTTTTTSTTTTTVPATDDGDALAAASALTTTLPEMGAYIVPVATGLVGLLIVMFVVGMAFRRLRRRV